MDIPRAVGPLRTRFLLIIGGYTFEILLVRMDNDRRESVSGGLKTVLRPYVRNSAAFAKRTNVLKIVVDRLGKACGTTDRLFVAKSGQLRCRLRRCSSSSQFFLNAFALLLQRLCAVETRLLLHLFKGLSDIHDPAPRVV